MGKTKAKGISLHIGVNLVDPAHYAGWSGPLAGCEADSEDMMSLAKATGFATERLVTKDATRARVTKEITAAADQLERGDIFFLTYSGHGGQLPDKNDDEPDGVDETWCLYDGELVDDQIFKLLGRFRAGVRIVVLSDSCHSGSVLKDVLDRAHRSEGHLTRAMPKDVAMRTYRQNKAEYDPILSDESLARARKEVAASAMLISGCQDNQLSLDGTFNGLFTGTLLRVWKDGLFKGDYEELHRQIVKRMPPTQTPNLFRVGVNDAAFLRQRPFSIDGVEAETHKGHASV